MRIVTTTQMGTDTFLEMCPSPFVALNENISKARRKPRSVLNALTNIIYRLYNAMKEIYYYKTISGRNPVMEFIYEQDNDLQEDFLDAVSRLAEGELLTMPLNRNLNNIYHGLNEIRLRDKRGIYRIFYYLHSKDKVFLLHAFKKKTQKIPKQDLFLILNRIRELKNAI